VVGNISRPIYDSGIFNSISEHNIIFEKKVSPVTLVGLNIVESHVSSLRNEYSGAFQTIVTQPMLKIKESKD